MSMNTIWKGSIQFAMVTIPVRIFNATSPEEGISFNQIHKGCHGLVGTNRYCKKCNVLLKTDDIVRGFEYAPSLYIVLEADDFDAVKLKSAKIVDLQGFVRAAEVHPSLYDTPYFIGPDGDVAPKAYALLRDAMKESGKVAIGKVIMRDKEATVMLSPEEHGILLYKLRSPQLLRTVESVPGVEKTHIDANDHQLVMARALIETLSVPLASIDLTDHYQAAIQDVITARVKGEKMIAVSEELYPVIDLDDALAQSIKTVHAVIPAPTLQVEMPATSAEAPAAQPMLDKTKTRWPRALTKMPKKTTSPKGPPEKKKPS